MSFASSLSKKLAVPTQHELDVHLYQTLIKRQISLKAKLDKKR